MKKPISLIFDIIILVLLFTVEVSASSAAPKVQWSSSFGGQNNDAAYGLIQASDGSLVLAGTTSPNGASGSNALLIKVSSSGVIQWEKTYGGSGSSIASAVVQSGEGGYVFAGMTQSYGSGGFDYWMVKTDSQGNVEWNRTFGGAKDDFATCIVKTNDGGYALAGWTNSFGAGGEDMWLVKTDSSGNMIWNQTYGGPFNDEAHALVQTSDGGYAIAGDTAFANGNEDAWLVKTDPSGKMEWNRTYGGTELDTALSILQLSNGNYVLAGYTSSFGIGTTNTWLFETDPTGIMQWNKTYGGPYDNHAYSMVRTTDAGFAFAGDTESSATGPRNYWIVKTDSQGNMEWNITNNGSTVNFAYSLIQTRDGGYALAGVNNTETAGQNALLVKSSGSSSAAQFPYLPVIALIVVIIVIVVNAIVFLTKRK